MGRLMGKGLAKTEKLGIFKSGVGGSKKQVPGKTGGSLPKPASKKTDQSKVAQPTAFTGNKTVRAQGYTRFVS